MFFSLIITQIQRGSPAKAICVSATKSWLSMIERLKTWMHSTEFCASVIQLRIFRLEGCKAVVAAMKQLEKDLQKERRQHARQQQCAKIDDLNNNSCHNHHHDNKRKWLRICHKECGLQ